MRALGVEGESVDGVIDAVAYIARLRQADLSSLPVGRRVVVVGGGNTAIDIATQTRRLGAEEVTILYRRGAAQMKASGYEQELAASAGVRIVCNAVPVRVTGEAGVREVECAYTEEAPEGLRLTGETFGVAADQVLTAIGQSLGEVPGGLEIRGGKIVVEGPGRTSLARVWAGGDCASGGDDLTVTAVAEGRDAAMDIDAALVARP